MSTREEREYLAELLEEEQESGRWASSPTADLYGFMADAVLAAGYRKPRTITTREEVYALAEGSVVLDSAGDVSQLRGGFWCSYEATEMTPQRLAKYIPAQVLYEGGAA